MLVEYSLPTQNVLNYAPLDRACQIALDTRTLPVDTVSEVNIPRDYFRGSSIGGVYCLLSILNRLKMY